MKISTAIFAGAILIYCIVLAYTFLISPLIKEESVVLTIEEEMSKEAIHVESDVCKQCHLETFTKLSLGNHSTVECVSCHGTGEEHAKLRTKQSIIVEDTRDACMLCHKKIAGRNIATVEENHGSGVRCSYCHDSHSANIPPE
ncbi:MAG: hypothetical protein NZ879_00750 [Archaeoglobaceae archaeon]|nr:hypothetical protein [Archaeoglobaceae archaeon]MDW8117495.1 hypothetical protein [Archaeoglobaceae archaeon]